MERKGPNFADEKRKKVIIKQQTTMKKVVLLALATFLFGMTISAEPISKGEARRIAEKWMSKKSSATRAKAFPAQAMKTDVVFNATNSNQKNATKAHHSWHLHQKWQESHREVRR